MTKLHEAELMPADLSPQTGADRVFDWRLCWYPVSFTQDLPRDRPTGFTLYDQAFVLFHDEAGQVHCLQDRCPHRAARLSDGQMRDGRLECLYHGWQFGAGGRCLLIPQLYPDKNIPDRAHVAAFRTATSQGIVWVWPGEAALADEGLIPVAPQGQLHSVTFQMDLPYDQTYLIENVIDVAHIHIAHDGVRGGGRREAAKPLEFRVLDSGITGIQGSFRSVGLVRDGATPALGEAVVEFVAPNLIRYQSKYQDPTLVAGLDLYSLPMGKGKCRLLYRKYSNFTGLRERVKPRWLEHLTQCKILEQDMAVVVGQHATIEADTRPLADIWLPLKTSDRLVIEYRRWLDRFGSGMPFYRGFATAQDSALHPAHATLPAHRHVLHTKICATCGRLSTRLGRAIAVMWGMVAVAGVVSVLLDSGAARGMLALGVMVLLLAIVAARHLRAQL